MTLQPPEYIVSEWQLQDWLSGKPMSKYERRKMYESIHSRPYQSERDTCTASATFRRQSDCENKTPSKTSCGDCHYHQSERETLHLSSSDLLLIAHDEWKRREERKHIHEHISWVNGWISGFLTSRKFVREQLIKLRQQTDEPEFNPDDYVEENPYRNPNGHPDKLRQAGKP
jgi:hypothetical protein